VCVGVVCVFWVNALCVCVYGCLCCVCDTCVRFFGVCFMCDFGCVVSVCVCLYLFEFEREYIRPPLLSRRQSFWLQILMCQFRSLALPDFLSSIGSGTVSTQPREPCDVN